MTKFRFACALVVIAATIVFLAWIDTPETVDPIPEDVRDSAFSVLADAPGAAAFEGGEIADRYENARLEMKFRWCPAGEFVAGSPDSEAFRRVDEQQVDVSFERGFWMAETEVTRKTWQLIMNSQPWNGRGAVRVGGDGGPNLPAIMISQVDAMEFCNRLTALEQEAGRLPEGWQYRLPTEAEREYACRAGTTTAYGFGDDPTHIDSYAWTKESTDSSNSSGASPVGRKLPNNWGLFDMHGNVTEWCLDSYRSTLGSGADPLTLVFGGSGLVRGGSWQFDAPHSRSASRGRAHPLTRSALIGFRPVIAYVRKDLSDR